MNTVAGLLLAAGAGRRMGRPKGLLRDGRGTAWVTRSAEVLMSGGCSPVIVVVGASADDVAGLVPEGVEVVRVSDWAEGMGASLRAGLSFLARSAGPNVVAVLVGLVDTPGVTEDVVRTLVGSARQAGPPGLARAAYQGEAGHPVALGRAHWTGVITSARGDAGARAYLTGQEVVLVECGAVGHGRDVDGPGYLCPMSADTARPGPGDPHPALAPGHAHAERVHDDSRITPPARRVVVAAVTDRPLDVVALQTAVSGPGSGAVVTFAGVVRDHDRSRSVHGIEYVAHPSAATVLAEVVADVTARSAADAVAVSHRIGDLAVGDAALVVAVAAAHRQEAFAAAALMVDEVKHRLPIWKRQVFTDGTDEWVACP